MITVDIPRPWLLNANQRLHWRQKATRSRCIRTAAWAAFTPNAMTFQRRVRLVALVKWPDKRRRDVHNLMPTVKACVDGIVDAKWLHDDSDKWLIGPDLRVSDTLCDKQYACSLTFTFEEA